MAFAAPLLPLLASASGIAMAAQPATAPEEISADDPLLEGR